ncbi:Large ribosomal subunit protein [Trichinella spiralis]|uniref:Large ribosomal subunit protein n=1 Tax=Trichinella spiralis TaxID=6334 RepID=A0ABR3K614_TRISP
MRRRSPDQHGNRHSPLWSSVCSGGEVFDYPVTACMSEFRRTEGTKQKAMEMDLSKLGRIVTIVRFFIAMEPANVDSSGCLSRDVGGRLPPQDARVACLIRLGHWLRQRLGREKLTVTHFEIDVPIRLQSSLQCQVACVVFCWPLHHRKRRLTPEPKLSNRVSDVAVAIANSYNGRTKLFDFRSSAQNCLPACQSRLAQHLAKRREQVD